ncbi:MAG: DnaD domain protein [Faecalibacterium prausnitzii]|nr:DnaD domain protein [Faecalibacterium prausnitzii]
MANKRMFSIDVTETDSFLEMPLTAQALYFHLGMRGDDDGFVSNPRSIMRVTGCSEGDLAMLAEAGYIISFRSGVIVISDWKVNNNLRNDRYKPTTFQYERSMLSETANKRYILNSTPVGNQMDTNGIPSDDQMTPQPNVTQRNQTQRSSSGNDTAAAADPRTDPGLAEIVQHFQDVIGIFPRSALNKLQRWREVYPAEIIHAAIDEADENNVRKWRYVDGVLKGWQADGVRTLGDVEARREARKKPERKMEVLS